ncbi:IucA/IucC family protein [Marinobacter sp.]|uniref:IucA/IucC family protein n=1 Tax=Marinobacter sp. TaxID=50741 RepID=UPI002356BCF5|nr:IucA/IucC family protein [Marinobacter sp.]
MTHDTPQSPTKPERYLTERVINALIREDVAGCQSESEIVESTLVPGSPAQPGTWLRWELTTGTAWVPVRPARFMQEWQWSGHPVIWQPAKSAENFSALDHYAQVLPRLASFDNDESQRLVATYLRECQIAESHHSLCREEQERWFSELRQQGLNFNDLPQWSERMLHFDRLAAFLDHPFYPSARAKSGFDGAALADYAPEFAPRFQLRWLAIPGSELTLQGELPQCWPSFSDVGLDCKQSEDHYLLPVHPHLWDTALDQLLSEAPIGVQVIRAPKPALWVRPTLSVRTVQIEAEPDVHLKVPLTIRTLGDRNIRTVKPSTLYDGHAIQQILEDIANNDQPLSEQFAVTDESSGLHVGDLTWLGCILRRFPAATDQQQVLPVASLLAEGPDGRCVAQLMADTYAGGDLRTWVRRYVAVTLSVHLRLWLKYGIALESNQQNSMLVHAPGQPPRLLFKDNDAPRLWPELLLQRTPSVAPTVDRLRDQRILVDNEIPLLQMFTTITLQLNLAVILEGLSARGLGQITDWYQLLRGELVNVLDQLDSEGIDTSPARGPLLHDRQLYTKYLLRAGSLESKSRTGAADINKFYGKLAPNFLRPDS